MVNNPGKKIAKNTLMLYFRMLLSMVVTLYTSRVVLNTLGVQDFGIYNVVGGIVVMLGFLNYAMTASTQRFLTFEIGKNDIEQLKRVFSMSITIHAIIGMVVFVLAETIGLWFLNSYLIIPHERMYAANVVYQFSILSFIVTVLSVPYNAAIIANERMNIYAFVGIFEVTLKLVLVFLLVLTSYDKLILYAFLLFVVSIILRIIEGTYCKKHFEESKNYKFIWDKDLFKSLGNFASWNLLGVSAGIGYNQGVNILLNIFFGPTINAARGIAFQVQSAINNFVTNFQIAVNPSITKSYAKGEYTFSNKLVFSASKFSFYLLLMLSMPLLIETHLVLSLWLKIVPAYTVIFTRLVLIDILICSLSGALQNLAQATGNIKGYQIIVSGLLLLNLPTSYVFLKLGFTPEYTMLISIFYSFVALLMRLIILKKIANFPIQDYIFFVVGRVIAVAIVAFLFSIFAYINIPNFSGKFFIILLISTASIALSVIILGLNKFEKQYFKANYLKFFNKKISNVYK